MERLASYSLDITPGCPAGAASALRAGYRGPNGPSFREARLPTADGLSAYGAMAWEKVVVGRGEYSRPPVCNEIPEIPLVKNQPPQGCQGGDQLNIMDGSPDFLQAELPPVPLRAGRSLPGAAPAVDFVPQAWVLHHAY